MTEPTLTVTPKLDAEIERVQRERLAEGLHLLPRHKAIAQIAAERIRDHAYSRGMDKRGGDLDWIAWLILEPVIDDSSPDRLVGEYGR